MTGRGGQPSTEYLPPAVEQGRLIRDLRALIEACGFETFVSAPLLEPTPVHFPDRWRPDQLGVARLTDRLLAYAGLDKLQAQVELGDSERAAAWFHGIEEGRCHVGAAVRVLSTPDYLAGAMAHEVAHAYRHVRRLADVDRAIDEPLTDLTTVYLGFGILTANTSYRYRSDGVGGWRQWEHRSGGYLSPQAMSFLLAAQVVVRDAPAAERRRIAGQLEANQAAYFNAACAALDRDTLVERLGLPPPSAWPAVADPRPRAFDTTNDPPLPDLAEQAREVARTRHEGFPVFRVAHTSMWRYVIVAVPLATAATVAVVMATASPHALWIFPVAVLQAAFKGRRRTTDRCSEPECRAILAADVARCPGCGGAISGRIKNENARLEAREALEDAAAE